MHALKQLLEQLKNATSLTERARILAEIKAYVMMTGPRGGKFYYAKSGRKIYRALSAKSKKKPVRIKDPAKQKRAVKGQKKGAKAGPEKATKSAPALSPVQKALAKMQARTKTPELILKTGKSIPIDPDEIKILNAPKPKPTPKVDFDWDKAVEDMSSRSGGDRMVADNYLEALKPTMKDKFGIGGLSDIMPTRDILPIKRVHLNSLNVVDRYKKLQKTIAAKAPDATKAFMDAADFAAGELQKKGTDRADKVAAFIKQNAKALHDMPEDERLMYGEYSSQHPASKLKEAFQMVQQENPSMRRKLTNKLKPIKETEAFVDKAFQDADIATSAYRTLVNPDKGSEAYSAGAPDTKGMDARKGIIVKVAARQALSRVGSALDAMQRRSTGEGSFRDAIKTFADSAEQYPRLMVAMHKDVKDVARKYPRAE